MAKIQDVAHVVSVEIPEGLVDFNEQENAHRAKLSFVYVSNGNDFQADNDAQALLASLKTSAPYSLIIDLAKFNYDGNDTEKCKALEDAFRGKDLLFTTYEYSIDELTDGKKSAVHNDERTYAKLSNSYIGKNDDEAGVFQSIKDRLNRQIDDALLEWGELKAEENDNNRNRRH